MDKKTFKDLMTAIYDEEDVLDVLVLGSLVPLIDQLRNDEIKEATLDFCKKETNKIMLRNGWEKI